MTKSCLLEIPGGTDGRHLRKLSPHRKG